MVDPGEVGGPGAPLAMEERIAELEQRISRIELHLRTLAGNARRAIGHDLLPNLDEPVAPEGADLPAGDYADVGRKS